MAATKRARSDGAGLGQEAGWESQMTWGSNASFQTFRCHWCGGIGVDDRDVGPSTHQASCPSRPLFGRFGKLWALCHPISERAAKAKEHGS